MRDITARHGAVLIFDEVMTGFRVAAGGAQELFGIRPDLTTLGKVIGGGLPVGAYGGRADIMSKVSPAGPVYQAGTLSGNPVAMTAGLWALKNLGPTLYRDLARRRCAASGQRVRIAPHAVLHVHTCARLSVSAGCEHRRLCDVLPWDAEAR